MAKAVGTKFKAGDKVAYTNVKFADVGFAKTRVTGIVKKQHGHLTSIQTPDGKTVDVLTRDLRTRKR